MKLSVMQRTKVGLHQRKWARQCWNKKTLLRHSSLLNFLIVKLLLCGSCLCIFI